MIKQFIKYYLRNGKAFKKYLKELRVTEKYSRGDLQQYQNEKLRQTICSAYKNVPYYRNVFDKLNLKPSDIKVKEDLTKIPIIDKDIVKKYFPLFRNKNYKGSIFKAETSGTTGTPGTFLRDLSSINFENAAVWRFFQNGGKLFKTPRVSIRGDIIFPIEQRKPPFWRYDSFQKELLLSGYHINEENLALYVKEIKKYMPCDLYAYPSTAHLLADYCHRNKIVLPFTAVFTSSEMVFPYQRELIEQTFPCKLFDWYGQVERVSAIGQCAYGTYHVQEDYSIVEFQSLGNGKHEMIGTTLHNTVMPLIRYKTDDIIELNESPQCLCKQKFREVKRILGREGDIIRTPDKRIVSILNHIPRGVNHLIELQFVQRKIDEVILRIICSSEFSRKDEAVLIKNAQEHISHEMSYVIEKVTTIKRSKRGKFIPVLSELETQLL